MDEILGEATLSSCGQLTIPKSIRDALFLAEGSQVTFRMKEGEVVIAAAQTASNLLAAWFGKYPLSPEAGDAVHFAREMRGWQDNEISL